MERTPDRSLPEMVLRRATRCASDHADVPMPMLMLNDRIGGLHRTCVGLNVCSGGASMSSAVRPVELKNFAANAFSPGKSAAYVEGILMDVWLGYKVAHLEF
jgi:hypothetical protein